MSNRPWLARALLAAAAVAWLVGLLWTAQTRSAVAAARQAIPVAGAQFDSLQRLAMDLQAAEAARAEVRRAAGVAPDANAVAGWFQQKLPNVKVSDSRAQDEAVGEGWVRRERQWTFEEAPIAAVLEAASELERSRWRLRSIEIHASSVDPGIGRIQLVHTCLQPEG